MSLTSDFWQRRLHPKTAQQAWEERRERRRVQMGYGLLPITLESIADHENLYEVFKKARQGGQAPGIDEITYCDLSNSEVGEIMRALSATILKQTYRPMPTRAVPIPKPGKAEKRWLKIGVIWDRVVARALERRMDVLWSTTFLPCSYGFRQGYDAWKMLAELEARMVTEDSWVLAVDDLKSAFDNVPIPALLECHERLLAECPLPKGKKARATTRKEHEKLLWLIETVVRGSEITRQRGIDQGNPYSPTCLNALLNYYLDVPIRDMMEAPFWFRYADNLCFLARNVSEGRLLMRKVRRLLNPLGLTLRDDGGVHDLSKGKEAQLLGFTLRRSGNQVVFNLGKKAMNHLAQNLGKAHETVHPQETARQSLLGWVESVGPAFENGVTEIPMILRQAAEHGFRELASPDELQQLWKESWVRWEETRKRAYRQLQG